LQEHLFSGNVHMGLSISSRQSVALKIGSMKGKSAVWIHRQLIENKRVTALHFWSCGQGVRTVSLNEKVIINCIHEQGALEKRQQEVESTSRDAMGDFYRLEPARGPEAAWSASGVPLTWKHMFKILNTCSR